MFYVNIGLSLIVYGLLFIFAPYIAEYYEQALSIVHNTVMQRKLLFKLQIRTALPAAVLSGLLAVALAFLEYGVWALIAQMVAYTFINTALLWRTGIWAPNLRFSFLALKPLIKFGSYMLVNGINRELFATMYLAVIAKVFTLGVAGLCFFADKVKELIVQQLVSAIQQVTYPALSQIQDDDVRLKQGYRKVIQLSVFLIFPVFILFCFVKQTFLVFKIFYRLY